MVVPSWYLTLGEIRLQRVVTLLGLHLDFSLRLTKRVKIAPTPPLLFILGLFLLRLVDFLSAVGTLDALGIAWWLLWLLYEHRLFDGLLLQNFDELLLFNV